MKKLLLFIAVIVLSLSAFAQNRCSITGEWTGRLNFLGSEIDIFYIINHTDSSITAVLNVPAQDISNIEIDTVRFDGQKITLSDSHTKTLFKGIFGGESILGDFHIVGIEIPVVLTRKETTYEAK